MKYAAAKAKALECVRQFMSLCITFERPEIPSLEREMLQQAHEDADNAAVEVWARVDALDRATNPTDQREAVESIVRWCADRLGMDCA